MLKKIKDFLNSFSWLSKKFTTFVPLNLNKYDFDLNKKNKSFIDLMNEKICSILPSSSSSNELIFLDYNKYLNYFNYLNRIGLMRSFKIKTSFDSVFIKGSVIFPIIKNKNNKKVVIFCHGVTEDRWSNFYIIHLSLQRGYKVIAYDARNHGESDKSFTTLGQIEAFDLNDVIDWANETYKDIEKIGVYGFSMGASTCIFWLKRFWMDISRKKIGFIIIDSVFDKFDQRKDDVLGFGVSKYFKNFLLEYAFKKRLDIDYDNLKNVNPILNLPPEVPTKILFLHGFSDSFVSWKSSLNIFKKLRNLKGGGNVSFYICKFSNHCEFPIISDFIPHSLFSENINNPSLFPFFSNLFFNFLEINL